MGLGLCSDCVVNLSKFPNINLGVADLDDENNEMHWKEPEKIKNDKADERNDDSDIKHKLDSGGKAAKAGKRHRAESGQHLNVKNDMAVEGNNDMETKPKSDSEGKAAKAGNHHRSKSGQHLNAKNDMAVQGNDGMDTKHKWDAAKVQTRPRARTQPNPFKETRPRARTQPNAFKTAPVLPKLNEKSSLETKPTGNWRHQSLATKMKERRNNPNQRDEFAGEGIQEEQQAKVYMDAVQDNTVDQITETFQDLESIIQKEVLTMDELKRQAIVIQDANDDIHAADNDINETNHRLHGMISLGNKLANIMFRKPLHTKSPQVYDEGNEHRGWERSSTTPIKLPSCRNENKSDWINKGVDKLLDLLEVVEYKEIDLGHELEKQEGAIQHLDENIEHIEDKIAQNTKLMSRMTRK